MSILVYCYTIILSKHSLHNVSRETTQLFCSIHSVTENKNEPPGNGLPCIRLIVP